MRLSRKHCSIEFGRWGQYFDRLEPRQLLAADVTMITANLGNVVRYSESPSSLTLTRKVDSEIDFTLFFMEGEETIGLVRVDDSGNLADGPFPLPISELSENHLTLSLESILPRGMDRLPTGHYRIYTSIFSLMDPPKDQTIAEFTVVPDAITGPERGLKSAVDLGTIGAGDLTRDASGVLNPATGHNSYALYKLTLPADHRWRLGLQLDADRLGSNLQGAIALFDSQGNVLKVSDAGSGVGPFVNDPYLFQTLQPGVYYIGVSGKGNRPDSAGGYNPSTSFPGTLGSWQAGGKFDLHIVADPDVPTTQVLGYNLEWANQQGNSPTGLNLDFSGALDPATLQNADGSTSLTVVDRNGVSWPLTFSRYDFQQVRARYVFNQPLPLGDYSLINPVNGGLTDLGGEAPVTTGLPAGVLARFSLSVRSMQNDPGNVQILWPDGLKARSVLSSGQSVDSRLIVLIGGFYKLETPTTGGLAIQLVGPDGSPLPDLASDQKLHLQPGEYLLTMTAAGSDSTQVDLTFTPVELDHESIVDNGVGQSGALALRFAGPSGPVLGPETISAPTPLAPSGIGSAVVGNGPISVVHGTGPTSLLVTINTGLAGRPSSQPETIAVVGPTVLGGSVALAYGSADLLPGFNYRSNGSHDTVKELLVGKTGEQTSEEAAAGMNGESSVDPASEVLGGDILALVNADRIASVTSMLRHWFANDVIRRDPVVLPDAGNGQSQELYAAADPGVETTDHVEHAEFGVPTSMIVAVAVGYRLRQLAMRWWRRSPGMANSAQGMSRSVGPGRGPYQPHRLRTRRIRIRSASPR